MESTGIGRRVRRFLQGLIAPTLFLSLVGYFGWNATQGERGLQTYALRQEQLRGLQAELQRTAAEKDALERRVAGLRTSRLDPDALDERARAMLNVAEPSDIVVMYPPGKRLY